jgi:FlaA1/EpsC-like NDP-sugar epimerase
VLGGTDELTELCASYRVDEVIIAIPSASNNVMKEIVALSQAAGVKFKTLPGVGSLIDGKVSVTQIRDVDMEDLLGREAACLDLEQIKEYLTDKRILITGAGGSIGSELCRQLARFKPAQLILFESAETPLFHIENELRAVFPGLVIQPVIGDIRDRSRVNNIFKSRLPEVVFHAAAYKHVPMMEENPCAAANNNVRGTRVVAEAADHFGTTHFVMVSTDKAVNPTNIMGTSKRVAEIFVQNLARRSKTHFVTVRFGNVLGSNGSVIPTFREQIKNGGPVTVTHRDVTRFFMSIPEAAQLVLQAGSMGKGGEIFLLDMGESVKITELAESMIRLSGFEPYEEIDIEFTGLRPGEKLYEELLLDGEGVKPTSHEMIRVASSTEQPWEELLQDLDALYDASQNYRVDEVIQLMRKMVPEYKPVVKLAVVESHDSEVVPEGLSKDVNS